MKKQDFQIEFSQLDKNLTTEARERILTQFKSSPILDQFLQVISIMNQRLYNQFIEILKQRTVYEATGINLDIVGDIVGQKRGASDNSVKLWFTPDSDYTKFDHSPLWVEGADLSGNERLLDDDYRKIIVSKIFKNYLQYSSIPELKEYVSLLTGYTVGFRKTGDCKIALVVSRNIPLTTLVLLLSKKSDKKIDSYYVLPIPAGVELDEKIYYIEERSDTKEI